jgi:hypothetical protein
MGVTDVAKANDLTANQVYLVGKLEGDKVGCIEDVKRNGCGVVATHTDK